MNISLLRKLAEIDEFVNAAMKEYDKTPSMPWEDFLEGIIFGLVSRSKAMEMQKSDAAWKADNERQRFEESEDRSWL